MKNNFTSTFIHFLKNLNAKVTKTTAERYVETHPDYPSMLAYADALDAWKIDNAAIRIEADKLSEIPIPFVTYSTRHGGMFSLIRNVADGFIERLDTETGWVKDKLEDFLSDWTGVVMLAELNEQSGETHFGENQKKEWLGKIRIPIALCLFSIMILFAFFFNAYEFNFTIISFGITKIAFAIISTLLLIKSIDTNNPFVNKLCNAGTKLSCQSILESKAAKITDWLSLSDLGFIYGTGSLLAFLFCLGTAAGINIFLLFTAITSSIGILFSIYSIYYQAIKAKLWCTLCLGFVTLFWIEFIITITFFNSDIISLEMQIKSSLSIITALLIPISFLLVYKKPTIKAGKSRKLEIELEKLKGKPEVLMAILNSQLSMPKMPKGIGIVNLFESKSLDTLTIVTNPLCGWCSIMHKKVSEALKRNPVINCEVVFLTIANKEDFSNRIASTILSLSKEMQSEALDLWFERNDRNIDEWQKQFTNEVPTEVAYEFLELQRDWCNKAEIKGTPELFFKGKKIPFSVDIEDLITVVERLEPSERLEKHLQVN